jgi:hypothetical protein
MLLVVENDVSPDIAPPVMTTPDVPADMSRLSVVLPNIFTEPKLTPKHDADICTPAAEHLQEVTDENDKLRAAPIVMFAEAQLWDSNAPQA